jgi:hypothetical protein
LPQTECVQGQSVPRKRGEARKWTRQILSRSFWVKTLPFVRNPVDRR